MPFVLIGHSKLFNRYNENMLRGFLSHVRRHPDRFAFGRFGDFPLAVATHVEGCTVPSAGPGRASLRDLTMAR
jgi:hypothetical protein